MSGIDPRQAEDLFVTLLDVLQRLREADLVPVSRSCMTCEHLVPGIGRSHRCTFFDETCPRPLCASTVPSIRSKQPPPPSGSASKHLPGVQHRSRSWIRPAGCGAGPRP